jgi:Ca-activated chloride channel family protein
VIGSPPLALGLQAPLFLLLLLAVPLLAWLYVRHERRGSRGAAAFASPALLPAVAPVRPRWRRHVPLAFYALALMALVVALARPEMTVAVPDDQARVVLVIDQSGSMAAKDVPPSRWTATQRAVGEFLDRVPDRVRVGAIVFNKTPRVIHAPTRDRAAVRQALGAVSPIGSTAVGDALWLTRTITGRVALKEGDKPPPAAVILLSDGASVHGRNPLEVAGQLGDEDVPIYTISLGTDAGTIPRKNQPGVRRVPPRPQAMERIAEASGGRSFDVTDATGLETVYERLGKQVARKDAQRQVTSAVAGGALLLLLAGGASSLFWFGRLP